MGDPEFVTTVYDKRTGKPMSSSEVGMVQYQYYNDDGQQLNIRRNFDGNLVEGANEMMPIGADNLMGSIYIGPNNPTTTDENGKERPDYRREPQDLADALALQHDKDYDKVKAKRVTFNLRIPDPF